MLLYNAVSSPLDYSKHFTLCPLGPGRPVHSDNNLITGKHSSHAPITREDHSLTFPPLSIPRYGFIQLSELGRRGENENAQAFSKGRIQTQVLSIASPAFYR